MIRDDFLDLLHDYGVEKQDVSSAYEWGSGVLSAERRAEEAHAAVMAEYDKLRNALLWYALNPYCEDGYHAQMALYGRELTPRERETMWKEWKGETR